MSYLRIDVHLLLLLQYTRHTTNVAVVNSRNKYSVEAVEMSSEVPKAGLSRKATIDEHIKTIDAKECGITLTTGEDVQRGMTEAYVADHIGRFHQLVQSLSYQILFDVVRETRDRRHTGRKNVIRIDSYAACP